MQTDTLAIDFGTSNSAAAVLSGDTVRRLPMEAGAETLPTAVFFPEDCGIMRLGANAADALIAGEEGRYMRALKSVLGLPLVHESRLIAGKRRTIAGIVTEFLTVLRKNSEAQCGHPFRRALSGRPVHFHSSAPDKDAQAEADLRACYLAAGFEDVEFLAEPVAAAVASQRQGGAKGLGLVVDIGGGTSDFTVFEGGGDSLNIVASHGIRLGGTDFDQAISLAHAMPLLGLGGQLRREFGSGTLPVPRAPFVELATWAKIPFLYNGQTRRKVAEMARMAVDRDAMDRFCEVLELELGHELAFAVERGKISANSDMGFGQIDMGYIESGLTSALNKVDMDRALQADRVAMRTAMADTLQIAGVPADKITNVTLVGGSSLMNFVTEEAAAICPNAAISRADAFTAVIDGLALASATAPN